MKLERHIYEKDKIVIGGDLSSLLFAFNHDLPVIFIRSKPPFRYDEIENYDLSFMSLDSSKVKYQKQIWEQLLFLLGLSGKMPLSNNVSGLRVVDNLLTAVTNNHRVVKYSFNKLIIFDDEDIFGLPAITDVEKDRNRVLDWVNVRRGCRHSETVINREEDFVNKIIFYPSDRTDNKTLKDLVTISYLTDEQLLDHDYSDTMVRFKVTKIMKTAGIVGAELYGHSRHSEKPKEQKFYEVELEPSERVVEKRERRYYEQDERFEFRHDTIKELLQNLKKPEGYLGKLCERI